MNGRQQAEVFLLLGVGVKHSKPYVWPSQRKVLELLDKYNDYKISRRTLNRDFRILEDGKWFLRIKRNPRVKCGKRVFRSTLFKFGPRLFKWLKKMEDRVHRLWGLYRVPKMAQYQAKQKRGILCATRASVEIGLVSQKVGPLIGQISDTG